MYFLHTIGALIKERAIWPLVKKLKRHHSSDSEEAPLSTPNISSSGTIDNFAKRSLTNVRHINFEGPATLLIPTRVKEQHHCLITRKSQYVSTSVLRGKADWQKCPTLLTFEKTLPTRLLAQKSKRHHSPNLESQTPNKITCSKIEEALPSPNLESQTPNRIIFQKSKRHCYLNLKSQTPNRIAFSKIEEAPLSESREPNSQ
ncbi:hypothetical protein ACFX1R_006653 [Malus domestica]